MIMSRRKLTIVEGGILGGRAVSDHSVLEQLGRLTPPVLPAKKYTSNGEQQKTLPAGAGEIDGYSSDGLPNNYFQKRMSVDRHVYLFYFSPGGEMEQVVAFPPGETAKSLKRKAYEHIRAREIWEQKRPDRLQFLGLPKPL